MKGNFPDEGLCGLEHDNLAEFGINQEGNAFTRNTDTTIEMVPFGPSFCGDGMACVIHTCHSSIDVRSVHSSEEVKHIQAPGKGLQVLLPQAI